MKNIIKYRFGLFSALLLHLLMFLTGYVQEDAFISFKVGFNLADYGVYSNNVNEFYSGATSLLYGHYIALIRILFGINSLFIIRILNIFYCLFSSFLLTEAVSHFNLKNNKLNFNVLFFVIAANPAILKISGSGMETSLLLFFMSLFIFSVTRNFRYLTYFSLFILPFIRVDSIAFSFIGIFFVIFYDLRLSIYLFLSLFSGVVSYLFLNKLLTNSYLPVTIIAKKITLIKSDITFNIFSKIIWKTFFSESYFLGIYTRYLPMLFYGLSFFIFFGFVIFVSKKIFNDINFEYKDITFKNLIKAIVKRHFVNFVLLFSTIFIPISYAIGGVIYPWYLWPFSVFVYTFFVCNLIPYKKISNTLLFLTALFSCLCLMIQMNIAKQDTGFRASIGRYINSNSNENQTLLLEPAGVIPYYADCNVVDVVGLSSGRIIDFHKRDKHNWWLNYVMTDSPDFILDRGPVHEGISIDGKKKLSYSELIWFNSNYELLKEFIYKDYIDNTPSFFTPILKLGSSTNFYLYKKRKNSKIKESI